MPPSFNKRRWLSWLLIEAAGIGGTVSGQVVSPGRRPGFSVGSWLLVRRIRCQVTGSGSSARRWTAVTRSLVQGQPAAMRRVVVRAVRVSFAATCSSR